MDNSRHLKTLKWQMRRGKLELDLVLQRFAQRHSLESLDDDELVALAELLQLPDEQLLDLVLKNETAPTPGNQQMLDLIVSASSYPAQ
ncbi:MAG TPA: hypothetical protein DCF45_08500 [Gammaproteobacteria bacterium]|nr:hypothetical protein [Gammaproteobacteria bacterium]